MVVEIDPQLSLLRLVKLLRASRETFIQYPTSARLVLHGAWFLRFCRLLQTGANQRARWLRGVASGSCKARIDRRIVRHRSEGRGRRLLVSYRWSREGDPANVARGAVLEGTKCKQRLTQSHQLALPQLPYLTSLVFPTFQVVRRSVLRCILARTDLTTVR